MMAKAEPFESRQIKKGKDIVVEGMDSLLGVRELAFAELINSLDMFMDPAFKTYHLSAHPLPFLAN